MGQQFVYLVLHPLQNISAFFLLVYNSAIAIDSRSAIISYYLMILWGVYHHIPFAG